jgi:cobalt transporter subunit CbtA
LGLLRRIVLVAALAGLIAGLGATLAHAFGTVPLILRAETYERAAPAHEHEDGWKPEDGIERASLTALADVLTGVGFGLLLVSAYALRGRRVGWREGLCWGLAGFATFSLAPALGLPPELPGSATAPLLDRQLWWLATAAATGGGLALILLRRGPAATVAGLALLVLPHLYGAPAHEAGATPEALADRFVLVVLGTSFLFWLALGAASGLLYERLSRGPAAAQP